ncbi:MAG: (Fe-S)-binding protein, partial [Deltaproteobacteria bacterium]
SLVKELVDAGRLTVQAAEGLPAVTYHDSCHLKRKLQAHEPPRELLGAAGFEIKEMKDSDVCCGMGGSYSLKFPEISAPILARKLENVKATGVGTVAMDCPGCMLQIGGGLDLVGSPAKVRHVAELIADKVRPAAGK